MPASQKKIELVPSEEIQLALTRCVQMAYNLSVTDAVSEALSLLGFQRSTAKAKEIVESELTNLTNAAILRLLERIKQVVMTLTFDNGDEFSWHSALAKQLECETYFAKP